MSRDEVRTLTERVANLARRLADAPRLQAEVHRARRQFFGNESGRAGDDAAEHRFVEWFLLERESESLGAVPATVPPYDLEAAELEGSIVGAYLVQSVSPTITVKDVQDESIVEVELGPGLLTSGDLLIGRLFPGGGERWLPSVASKVLSPGREIATAFARDLARAELDRRLYQIELEHLLSQQHRGTVIGGLPAIADDVAAAPLEHLEADLDKLLRQAGSQHSATAISQQLADSGGPGAMIGPLLDELAFDTEVDLENARRLLLTIWNAQHTARPPSTEDPAESLPSGPPGETLGEQLVRKLDEGLGQKRDVEELFSQIERMAGIEDDDEHDAVDGGAAGATGSAVDDDNDPGDLSPLVAEYLWESGRDDDPVARPLTMWVELQRNAPVPRTDFETIATTDLMRLLLHVYLGSAPHSRAASVRGAFAELGKFYDWVAKTHEIDQRQVLQDCHGVLLDQLERLQSAGQALSTTDAQVRVPGLLQIEDVGGDGFGARDDDGGHHWLLADQGAIGCLQVGDLVLGALAPVESGAAVDGRRLQGLVVVLPIDARSLIE